MRKLSQGEWGSGRHEGGPVGRQDRPGDAANGAVSGYGPLELQGMTGGPIKVDEEKKRWDAGDEKLTQTGRDRDREPGKMSHRGPGRRATKVVCRAGRVRAQCHETYEVAQPHL